MKIIDKAAWQIDGGISEELVVEHFRTIFLWLERHEMLTEEGKEELSDGIDNCISLHEELITKESLEFLEKNYDKYLKVIGDKYGKDLNAMELEKIYMNYKSL